ncbi:hypothetical protein JCM19992_08880 [Thermostilla marina]
MIVVTFSDLDGRSLCWPLGDENILTWAAAALGRRRLRFDENPLVGLAATLCTEEPPTAQELFARVEPRDSFTGKPGAWWKQAAICFALEDLAFKRLDTQDESLREQLAESVWLAEAEHFYVLACDRGALGPRVAGHISRRWDEIAPPVREVVTSCMSLRDVISTRVCGGDVRRQADAGDSRDGDVENAVDVAFRRVRRLRRRVAGAGGMLAAACEGFRFWNRLQADFDRAVEQARLEAMAEFAAGTGHEINNPLAAISTQAQLLLREVDAPAWRHSLELIRTQAMRAHEMIADSRVFARPPRPEYREVATATLVEAVRRQYADHAERIGARLRIQHADDMTFRADPKHLETALGAVVKNALEALPENGGEVVVRWESDGDRVRLIVDDTGVGLTEEQRRHAFDPYYSARQAGRGLGLGLSKCRRLVEQHAGTVTIVPRSEGGTRVTLELPVRPPDDQRDADADDSSRTNR